MFAPDDQGSASAPRDHASTFPEVSTHGDSAPQRATHAGANDHPSTLPAGATAVL